MLKLKFDSKLDYQIDAINSVIDLFKGQTKQIQSSNFSIVPNVLNLSKEVILQNLQEIQNKSGIALSNAAI